MKSKIDLPDGFETRSPSDHYDIERIIELCCQTWGEEGRPFIEAVILNHPRLQYTDHFMRIEKTTGTLCSYLCCLPDHWTIEGLEIPVDHMEFVNTHPEHVGKGFIHLLNRNFNERSKEQGSVIQIVSGVPYFYRQLGYEYAAEAYGGRTIVRELIPRLPSESQEPVVIEQVNKNTISEYVDYRRKSFTGLLTRTVKVEDYDYLSFSATPTRDSITFYLVKSAEHTVGIFWLRISNNYVEMDDLYLEDTAHLNTILRFAVDFVTELGPMPLVVRPAAQELVDCLLEHTGGSKFQREQAWYIRIPDIEKFILHMIPLLEIRLGRSIYKKYTGRLRLSTYREVYHFTIEQGRINSLDSLDISVSREWECDLYLPPNAVPRLLMGYMTLDELERYDNDVLVRSSYRQLIDVMFPKVRTRALWSP
ncbi:MAG: GNAT family N-acetyltransferase [Candidatus Thorarchaeota archaeon]